jgi:hypothetical protein
MVANSNANHICSRRCKVEFEERRVESCATMFNDLWSDQCFEAISIDIDSLEMGCVER